ncbi:[LSU ribosomal protein L11P]-lysine N-methyltransferase [Sphingomonas gellani]|uniref:Ribosomal protein L11 methyltransferase n=1 Tax=Sphingomonas gellani TaxID=1166340 RepID=A0A1H8BC16_9SPHN|nr:50S ribosomal protein L11 methyltransferase [Sphingomonas gellani]SEM80286.1 [LSU ribosomal protein L11P]-lysine N-methyltransferase [Sphingomonas gellani]
MSAESQAAPDSWKVTLPCTRAEAEAIDAASDMAVDAVLMTTEEVEDDVERWRLDAYMDAEPDADVLAALTALVPSAAGTAPTIMPLTAEDWVAMSQSGLEPIREGRFVVHTDAFPAEAPAGGRAFLINAGQAFGTGHHGTTAGCLAMLDRLADRRFERVVDLGTGTGLLAFAARELWPEAAVMATDIDPIAIDVTRENAERNAVARVDLVVADGTRDAAIANAGQFDLIVANILAGPLIAMAPEIAAIAAPTATIVLAGLLSRQFDEVAAAYRAAGCRVDETDVRGDWTVVRLTAGVAAASGAAAEGDREAWATDS